MSDPIVARGFGQFIAEVEDGELHADLSRSVQDLVAALHDDAATKGGASVGTMTLALKFSLNDGVIEVTSNLAVKLPRKRRARSIFWATPENHLTRRNPRQADLPFRDVNAPAAPRTVI